MASIEGATRAPAAETAKEASAPKDIFQQASPGGHFRRQTAQFRNSISRDPSAEFPAEAGRYVLYINWLCPWAHRANLTLHLKGLEKIIQVVVMDYEMGPQGWFYSGRLGTATEDPIYGFKFHRELYHKADPSYDKRFTVPVLWDKTKGTIVNNESSEIIRILYAEFDDLPDAVPEELKEKNKPSGGLLPQDKLKEIDELNTWVYDLVNNGVYKSGFAETQEAYESNVYPLFEALDRLEEHLGQPGHSPYLFGEHITDADIRLYPTLIRFDVAYYTAFKCNLKSIRGDYPRLHTWLRRLYWDQGPETNGGAFQKTTKFEHIRKGYVSTIKNRIVPVGPKPDILPLEE